MKELLDYILKNLIEEGECEIEEIKEDNVINFNVSIDKASIGIVIGKGGKVIRAIQDIMRLRAKKEGISVYLNLEEKT